MSVGILVADDKNIDEDNFEGFLFYAPEGKDAEEIFHLLEAAPDLLAACKAQAKFDQHAIHCDRCGRAEKYCEDGWQLWNTAGNLRNQALAKAKGDTT